MGRQLPIVIVIMLVLAGCSQTQLVSHYAKKLPYPWKPSASPQYKVGKPYQVNGVWYYPKETFQHRETGIASWYGPGFHGKRTANGEIYDQNKLTAAHKTLQLPSLVRVTNLENGRSVVVRVNDRGPFAHGRVIDMSLRGAELLGFKNKGTARVRLEVLGRESQAIAAAAKSGKDVTRVASAQSYQQPRPPQNAPVLRNDAQMIRVSSDASGPAPVEEVYLDEKAYMKGAPSVPGHYEHGLFQPDPVVDQGTVLPTKIYVQAGAFTEHANATRLQQALKTISPVEIQPAMVRGQQFYRVRLGPLQSVSQADLVLEQVIHRGHTTARVIVD